jgi:hypothetical protein
MRQNIHSASTRLTSASDWGSWPFCLWWVSRVMDGPALTATRGARAAASAALRFLSCSTRSRPASPVAIFVARLGDGDAGWTSGGEVDVITFRIRWSASRSITLRTMVPSGWVSRICRMSRLVAQHVLAQVADRQARRRSAGRSVRRGLDAAFELQERLFEGLQRRASSAFWREDARSRIHVEPARRTTWRPSWHACHSTRPSSTPNLSANVVEVDGGEVSENRRRGFEPPTPLRAHDPETEGR